MDKHFEYPELKASFDLPEKISVNTNLRFWAGWRQAEDAGDYVVIKRWELVKSLGLLENWQCEYFADYKLSLDEIEDTRIADLIVRSVADVFQAMLKLRVTEKN
jgi:hypothetical protein